MVRLTPIVVLPQWQAVAGTLVGVLALQVLVVQWPPAQSVFDTTALEFDDWFKAVAVASSVLLLDELKKYMVSLARKF